MICLMPGCCSRCPGLRDDGVMARRRWWAAAAILLLAAGACTTGKARGTSDAGLGDPGNCVVVDMAVSLGYPAKPVGWADILNLAKDPQGWGAVGHPEFGPFKLGKTNPNFSTSGLNELIAQTYAASNKTSGLSAEDLDKADVVAFGSGIESSVVHYGDTTLTFLNNWYRADQRSSALNYVSAIAVEEKSVIDYNQGNPDGILDAGEQPRPPKVPLVAIYPKEGTLFSDSPFFTLDAPWVTQAQKDAAKVFETFVKEPDKQEQVLSFHFRPGNPSVPVGDPIITANGVDPNQPQTLLEVPPS